MNVRQPDSSPSPFGRRGYPGPDSASRRDGQSVRVATRAWPRQDPRSSSSSSLASPSSSFASSSSSSRFVRDLWVGHSKISVLLDTGADVNLIDEKWAAKHPSLERRTSNLSIRPAFGGLLRKPDIVYLLARARPCSTPVRLECVVAPLHSPPTLCLSDRARRALGIPLPSDRPFGSDSAPSVNGVRSQQLSWPCNSSLRRKRACDFVANGKPLSSKPSPRYLDEGLVPTGSAGDSVSAGKRCHRVCVPRNLDEVLGLHRDSFQPQLLSAGRARVSPIVIHVPPGKQIYVPPRPIRRDMVDDLRLEIDEMAKAKVIEPSSALHNTPLTVVRKPNGKLLGFALT